MNTGLDDPGLDRLRTTLIDRRVGRRPGRQLVAAREAHPPPLPLGDPAVQTVAAPAEPQSLGEMGRVVYLGVRERLERRGVGWEAASRMARRVAGAVVLEAAGFDRAEVVARLGTTERTWERDRLLLAELGRGVFDVDGDS